MPDPTTLSARLREAAKVYAEMAMHRTRAAEAWKATSDICHEAADALDACGAQSPRGTWYPMETVPKDRWVWIAGPFTTTMVWDGTRGMWMTGTGFWGEPPLRWTHWAEITGSMPPAAPGDEVTR